LKGEKGMEAEDILLRVENMGVSARIRGKNYPAVNNVSFALGAGETLGIVGESGCGKTLMALAVMRLLGENLVMSSGTVFFEGYSLQQMKNQEIAALRGARISMIFQEATDNLNPLMKVGRQVEDVLKEHRRTEGGQVRERSLKLLAQVRLPDPEITAQKYPHQLSGGQRQRVMIAMAIACGPSLLIADEPTTALDLTTQSAILSVIKEIQEKNGMGLILISHDISVIRRCCDRVAIMYSGRIVETGTGSEIFEHPVHPYTEGLISSIPSEEMKDKRLQHIAGFVPTLEERSQIGCGFFARCSCRREECATMVTEKELSPTHSVCCNFSKEASYER
jgi:oligopeptide/dipeptide ABC transporter, ATP-binding protein, C-terminal domain